MSNLFAEIRQALRSLGRSPGFTLPMVLVLGLGLGVNVALHGILQTVLRRQVPVTKRDELVTVRLEKKGETYLSELSLPQIADLQASTTPFQALTPVVIDSDGDLPVNGLKVHVRMPMVGPGWAKLLGLKMALGRPFSREEDAQGAPVMVLSHRLWQSVFHGDPAVIGRVLPLGNQQLPVTVVGVAAAGFTGLELSVREDAWMPLMALNRLTSLPQGFFERRDLPAFSLLGRLQSDLSLDQAQVAMESVSAIQAKVHPDSNGGSRYVLVASGQGERTLLDKVLPQRSLLLVAAGLALVLAVVGASGLFAARATRRERELATRCALGATTASLAHPLFLEALLLGILTTPVALVSGLALARRFMLQPGEDATRAALLPTLNGPILAFGLGLSLLALLASALLPLLRLRGIDPARALAGQGEKGATSQTGSPFVAAQVALSLALLAASSVALGAFHHASYTGYPAAHRALIVADSGEDRALSQRVLARLRSTPGVTAAARSLASPLEASGRATLGISGGDLLEKQFFPASIVGEGWFQALGVPLLQGRGFGPGDGTQQVILNETLARRLFPEGGAVGRRLQGEEGDRLEVIGVVADHRMRPDPDIHLPMVWISDAYLALIPTGRFSILVTGTVRGRALATMARDALHQEAPTLEPERVLTLEDHVAATLQHEHQNLRLLGALGLGSLALACFGLWAALNLQVALRGRELAIRTALGATAQQLAVGILRMGLRLLSLGLGAGALLTWALLRLSNQRWSGLPALSLLDLVLAAGALLAAGLLACLIPALRASRIQPAEALRSE